MAVERLRSFPHPHLFTVEEYFAFEDGWLQQTFDSMEDIARLEDLGCDLPLAAIYRCISFPNPQ